MNHRQRIPRPSKPLASALQPVASRGKTAGHTHRNPQRPAAPAQRLLVINICATGEYARPMWVQAHAVRHALDAAGLAARGITARVILTGDRACGGAMRAHWAAVTGLPVSWLRVEVDGADALVQSDAALGWNYSRRAQLLIARLREASFVEARRLGADFFWSLDSDVFPSPLALSSALDTLPLFGGLYNIVASPYPSQGGGSYLCGHGSPADPIHTDFAIHERRCPKLLGWLHARFTEWCEKRVRPAHAGKFGSVTQDRIGRAHRWLRDRVNQCPPVGSVWELQARGYRRRGWFDFAYPGIGAGAVVPSDWCGMGCTLLSRAALAVSSFSTGAPGGYDGGGTEDLYLCYRRWLPAGLRIAALPGAPSSHASRLPEGEGYLLHRAAFEQGGECAGHLRRRNLPLDWRAGQSRELMARAFFEV